MPPGPGGPRPSVPGTVAAREADPAYYARPMASGSKKTTRNKKQRRKPEHHLPKVGTPADNAYLQHESREDLVDFGLARPQAGRHEHRADRRVVLFLALGVLGLLALHLRRPRSSSSGSQRVVEIPPSTGSTAPVM